MFGDFAPTVRRRVVVTGIGLVTPVGVGAAATWRALCAGCTGTRALAQAPYFVPSVLQPQQQQQQQPPPHASDAAGTYAAALLRALPCQVVAPVCDDDGGASGTRDRFRPSARESRALLFARYAVHEALRDAQLLASSDDDGAEGAATTTTTRLPQTKRRRLCCDATRTGVNIGVGVPSLSDIADAAVRLYAPPLQHNNSSNCSSHTRRHTVSASATGASASVVPYHAAVHPFFVPKILGNMPAGVTAIEYGVTGPIGSSVAACATGAHCIGEAAEWVRSGRADVMICGAAEACLTPLAVAGFARMRALCTRYNDAPACASRPFDRDRGGFVMGEGAGVLVLESLDHARARGALARAYGEVRGFGVACDAHDVVAPAPDGRGAAACVVAALRDGGDVPASCVAYVNAHATGTMGDTVELDALARTLACSNKNDDGDSSVVPTHARTRDAAAARPLYISSTKGAMGHLLGAAGSVEAAVAVLALSRQLAPPTANLAHPCVPNGMHVRDDGHCAMTPRPQQQQQPQQPDEAAEQARHDGAGDVTTASPSSFAVSVPHGTRLLRLPHGTAATPLPSCDAVLSTSFGFGGVNTALLFTRV